MCMFCNCNIMNPSTTTHVVDYKGCMIIIKNVPCEECEQCGEKYYSDEVATKLEVLVNRAKCNRQEVAIMDYNHSSQIVYEARQNVSYVAENMKEYDA